MPTRSPAFGQLRPQLAHLCAAVWRLLRTPPIRRVIALVVFATAAWLIWRQLRSMSWQGFLAALAATAPWAVAASIGLTMASYACLAVTEWMALHALGHRLAFRQAATVAVPAYALTNSAGFSPATGAMFRVQLYGRRGIKPAAAAAVAMVAGAAVTLSGLATLGLLLLLEPAAAVGGPTWAASLLGVLLASTALLWFWAFTPKAPRWLGGRRPALEDPKIRALGLAAGLGDWLFSGAALFVLLPHPQLGLFPGYLAAYVAGSLLSAATGVPGGIGVFEAIVLGLTRQAAQVHETAAALLLYRCIYSLGPLGVWGGVSLFRRLTRRRDRESRPNRP